MRSLPICIIVWSWLYSSVLTLKELLVEICFLSFRELQLVFIFLYFNILEITLVDHTKVRKIDLHTVYVYTD